MLDRYLRNIDYMRVSITDQCNLRCIYCMPDDKNLVNHSNYLSDDEIVFICRCAAKLGIKKIKITGGEPLVRDNVISMIKKIKDIPEIQQLTLTTNGVLLDRYIGEIDNSFIDGINVSLDTLDREKYNKITGRDNFDKVWNGINRLIDKGISTKINCVPLSGVNDNELLDIAELAVKFPVDVRFIELMPIGYGKQYIPIKGDDIYDMLVQKYPDLRFSDEKRGNGPAVYYSSVSWLGKVGFINAVTKKFCSSCNRIRLTATGFFKSCLCYEDGIDIIQIVRMGLDEKKILDIMRETIFNKPSEHIFYEKNICDRKIESQEMFKIGG